MQLIAGLLSTIGAVIGSFVIHVAAHEFCAATPSLCKRLIFRASRKIEGHLSERYLEEWLADLEDKHTLYAKFRHSLDCYFCARKIAHQAETAVIQVRFLVPTVGTVPVTFILTLRKVSIFYKIFEVQLLQKAIAITIIIYFLLKLLKSAKRVLDQDAFKRFSARAAELLTFEYAVTVQTSDNKEIDFTETTKSIIERVSATLPKK